MLANLFKRLGGAKDQPAGEGAAENGSPAAVPPAEGSKVVVETPQGLLIIDPKDPACLAQAQGLGSFAGQHLQNLDTIGRELTAGAVALDVGAGIGVATLVLARAVGTSGTVQAFEPRRATFNMLAGNMALNGIDNVICRCEIPGAAPGARPARALCLDGLALERVDFIRIDAAAAPADVLAGGLQTISRARPVMAVGYPPDGPDAVGRILIDAGYVIYDAESHFLCWPAEHAMRALMMHTNQPWIPAAPVPAAGTPAPDNPAAPAPARESFVEHFDRNFAPLLDRRAAGFRIIFERLEAICRARGPGSPALIIETGSLRLIGNWRGDGQSTVLWKEFAQFYPCEIHTVDLDPKAADTVREACGDAVHAHTADSVAYLYQFARRQPRHIDLLYLDSFDFDVNEPFPSAFHHVKEMIAVGPCLGPGTIIGVDDNLVDSVGNITGKGFLLRQWFKHLEIPMLQDGYQYVWQL